MKEETYQTYEAVSCRRGKDEYAIHLLRQYLRNHKEDIDLEVNDFGELKGAYEFLVGEE